MKQMDHVSENLEVAKKPQLSREDFFEVVKPFRRQEFIEDDLDM